jgi:hypothetical protein
VTQVVTKAPVHPCLLQHYGNSQDAPLLINESKKMWHLYTTEFYSARKQNEILPLASKWMELENIILSDFSQNQKVRNHMFSCAISDPKQM